MKVIDYAYNPLQPFHFSTIDDTTTYKPQASDQVNVITAGEATQDAVNWLSPTLRDDGVYSSSFQVIPLSTPNDNLGSFKKLSYGFAIPSKVVNNTVVTFKFSGSVIAGSRDLVLSGHAGTVGTAGSSAHRQFSFGEFGSQSFSHTDTIHIANYGTDANLAFWVTMTNWHSSALPFRWVLNAAMWTSSLPYPSVRDVNAG